MNPIIAIFYELLARPLYNALIFLADVIPGGYLSIAIIILTLVIRIILLGPAAAAIRSQRAMQVVTPELDKIKKQYAGDQQKIANETMLLFKKHKVNPFGGCLPILIHLPILWAFFWVLKLGV
ncbi:MAG: YidC/Oxa1 family membrane protein insertase, partial [Patescibacteria group bacterium]|nr:YidC/Oxa1 family membrane protein insertase [Patescibacteria group bacterium]